MENLPDVLVERRHEYGSVVSYLPRVLAPVKDIIHDNLKTFLHATEIPPDWADRIVDIRRIEGLQGHCNWQSVKEMYEHIYTRYCQLHPEAETDRTIRSHFAGSLYDLAYCCAPYNRKVSLRAYMHALKYGGRSERHPSLIKYAALWFFGDWIWHAYRRLHRHE